MSSNREKPYKTSMSLVYVTEKFKNAYGQEETRYIHMFNCSKYTWNVLSYQSEILTCKMPHGNIFA